MRREGMPDARTAGMAHEHGEMHTARLHEISAQERVRLSATWSELLRITLIA